jgi:TolB-like protein
MEDIHHRTLSHALAVRDRAQCYLHRQGPPVDMKQVGRELGVRCLLEGSVRKSVDWIRISGLLIDASTGAQLWGPHRE